MTEADTKEPQPLKPCPFCGSNKINRKYDDGRCWEECQQCFSTGPANSRYKEDDDTDWNTRAAPVEPQPLKPCPLCRGTARFEPLKSHLTAWVECKICGCSVHSLTDNGAITAWNTRAAPVEPQPAMEMVGKVAEALAPFLYDLDGTDLHIRAAQAALSVIMPDLVKVREALNDMLYLSQDRQKAKEALAALDKMFNVTMK